MDASVREEKKQEKLSHMLKFQHIHIPQDTECCRSFILGNSLLDIGYSGFKSNDKLN